MKLANLDSHSLFISSDQGISIAFEPLYGSTDTLQIMFKKKPWTKVADADRLAMVGLTFKRDQLELLYQNLGDILGKEKCGDSNSCRIPSRDLLAFG